MPLVPVSLATVTDNVAVGVEQGAKYALIGPDGARAVFNDRDDVDFVGFLTAPPSGLDSPEVRESADLLVEADGGIHGTFYFGRRPFTLEGLIDPTPHPSRDTVTIDGVVVPLEAGAVTNRRINKLQRASRAMRSDSRLEWTPATAPAVRVRARRAAPLRISDRLPKRFSLSLVAADPRIYGQAVRNIAAAVNAALQRITSDGNVDTPPTVTVSGAATSPITIIGPNGQVRLNLTTVAGDSLVVDFDARTVVLNGVNRYDAVDFALTSWWSVLPGPNDVRVTAGGGAGTWRLDWRDAWV